MNERILKLAEQAGFHIRPQIENIQDGIDWSASSWGYDSCVEQLVKLVAAECIDTIETYQFPVGNSAAGEMACEWTHNALKEIRDEIKETFGVKS